MGCEYESDIACINGFVSFEDVKEENQRPPSLSI